jgi:hypothetical protein
MGDLSPTYAGADDLEFTRAYADAAKDADDLELARAFDSDGDLTQAFDEQTGLAGAYDAQWTPQRGEPGTPESDDYGAVGHGWRGDAVVAGEGVQPAQVTVAGLGQPEAAGLAQQEAAQVTVAGLAQQEVPAGICVRLQPLWWVRQWVHIQSQMGNVDIVLTTKGNGTGMGYGSGFPLAIGKGSDAGAGGGVLDYHLEVAKTTSNFTAVLMAGDVRTSEELATLATAGQTHVVFDDAARALLPPGYAGLQPRWPSVLDLFSNRVRACSVLALVREFHGSRRAAAALVDPQDGPYMLLRPPFMMLRPLADTIIGNAIGLDRTPAASCSLASAVTPEMRPFQKRKVMSAFKQMAKETRPLLAPDGAITDVIEGLRAIAHKVVCAPLPNKYHPVFDVSAAALEYVQYDSVHHEPPFRQAITDLDAPAFVALVLQHLFAGLQPTDNSILEQLWAANTPGTLVANMYVQMACVTIFSPNVRGLLHTSLGDKPLLSVAIAGFAAVLLCVAGTILTPCSHVYLNGLLTVRESASRWEEWLLENGFTPAHTHAPAVDGQPDIPALLHTIRTLAVEDTNDALPGVLLACGSALLIRRLDDPIMDFNPRVLLEDDGPAPQVYLDFVSYTDAEHRMYPSDRVVHSHSNCHSPAPTHPHAHTHTHTHTHTHAETSELHGFRHAN